ncbi:MAG: hypothetical protein ACM34I_12920 [bacterium]
MNIWARSVYILLSIDLHIQACVPVLYVVFTGGRERTVGLFPGHKSVNGKTE